MKRFSYILLAVALVLSMTTVGCRTSKKGVTPLRGGGLTGTRGLDEAGRVGIGNDLPIGADQFGGGEAADFNPDDMHQDRNALAAETIYFDYDSSSIRGAEEAKIDNVASVLRSDIGAKLLIEGHCDERGTEEYNRALGERRALSAREALALRGIDPGRIATRSYGEDRPADPAHSEAAWARNRRAEFVLLHPR